MDLILSQTYSVIFSNYFLCVRFDIIPRLRHVFQVLPSFQAVEISYLSVACYMHEHATYPLANSTTEPTLLLVLQFPPYSFHFLVTNALTHSLTHTHIHTLTNSLTHTLTHSLTHTTHTHTHTLTHPLTHHTFTHTHPHTLTHTHTTHSLTHTHTFTHSLSHIHTHSPTHTHSLTLSHTLTHSLTHTHTHSHTLFSCTLSPPRFHSGINLLRSVSLDTHQAFKKIGCFHLQTSFTVTVT